MDFLPILDRFARICYPLLQIEDETSLCDVTSWPFVRGMVRNLLSIC